MQGKAIILNGASSSGKSSIAKELQKRLHEPYLIMSVDHFFCTSPDYFFKYDPWMYDTDIPYSNSLTHPTDDPDFIRLMDCFPRIISGFHHSIRSMLDAGNNVIVDHGFHRLAWMRECLDVLQDNDICLIKVTCHPDTLVRRERKRGDRPIGMALYQESVVHRHVVYDLVVDTTSLKAKESAEMILSHIGQNPR